MKRISDEPKTNGRRLRRLAALSLAFLIAGGSSALAQLETAGTVLVDVDATTLAEGPITTVNNQGTTGGLFEAIGGGQNNPRVIAVGGDGTHGILFDGNDFMQQVDTAGGTLQLADSSLVGMNPVHSVEAWVLNATIPVEETVVAWGRRGGPDGSNASYNYGSSGAFGAIGHWAGADIGWNDAGGAPVPGVWHYLVWTYDGTTTRLYVDGSLTNSEQVVPALGNLDIHNDTPISIATQLAADTTPNGGLRGSYLLGKLRISNGALSDTQVADNYSFEQAGFTNGTPQSLVSGPTHRYTFNNPAAADATGAVIPDVVSGADGVVRNAGGTTTLTGMELTLSGGPSDTAPYVDLPNGLLSENSVDNAGTGEISIEGWVTVTGGRTWARIFDFGNNTAGEVSAPGGSGNGTNYFFLSAQIGDDLSNKRVEIKKSDTDIDTWDFGSYTLNQKDHFVLTWSESTGEVVVYENGVEVTSFTTTKRFSDIDDVNDWLGRSNWLGDQNMQGDFDEFRIYNRVLSPAEVLNNDNNGPDILGDTGALLAIHVQAARASMIVNTSQALTVVADYENASNVVINSGVTFTSGDTNILSVDAAGNVQGLNFGSAAITADYQGQTAQTTIMVIPPSAVLDHRYSFTSDATDSEGTADGELMGGATIGADGQLVLDAATMSYVQLPANILDAYDAVTVEAWASFGVNGNWNRLFDFGDTNAAGQGRNYIFFSSHTGPGDTRISISDADPGFNHEEVVSVPGTLDGQTNVHIVAVWHPLANVEAFYLNGCLAASRSNLTIQLSGVNDVLNFIGRSLYASDAYMEGSVDEFRIYNGVVTPQQIAVDAAAGPDTLLSDPGTLQSLSWNLDSNMVVEGVQSLPVTADFSSISNVNLCFGGVTYSSSDTNVVRVGADGQLMAVNPGMADIIANYNGLSVTQTVSVAAQPSTLVHRYSFNETVGSTVIPDLVGNADGTVVGGATFTGDGKLTFDGAGGYVDLPNGIISALTNATFEAWLTHNGSANWARVFDFGNNTGGEDNTGTGTSYLFLAAQGAPGFRFALKPDANSSENPILDGPGPLPTAQQVYVAVTYSPSGGVAKLYTNGTLVASGPAPTPLSTIDDVNNWLGRSQFTPDPFFTGTMDEFRIYEGALTADEIAASYAAGPDGSTGGGLKLQITLEQDGSITLSWPSDAADFFLESTTSLGDNPIWVPVAAVPMQQGDRFTVNLTPSADTKFFRLSQ